MVEKAVADWPAEGLPDRTAKTVEANRDALRPLLVVFGAILLKDLTVQNVHATPTKVFCRGDGSRRAIKIPDLMPQLGLRCDLARPARLAGGPAGS
jgi:hypothetical protein